MARLGPCFFFALVSVFPMAASAQEAPPGLDAALDVFPRSTYPGLPVGLTISLRNRTRRPIELNLRYSLSTSDLQLWVENPDGERVRVSSGSIGCGMRSAWPVLDAGDTHVEHNWELAYHRRGFQTPGTYRIHSKINLQKDVGWVDLAPVDLVIREPLGWDLDASKILLAAGPWVWAFDWNSEPYEGKPEARQALQGIVDQYSTTAYAPYARYQLATYKASSSYRRQGDARRWAKDEASTRRDLKEAIDLLEGLYVESLPGWFEWRVGVALARCHARAGASVVTRSMIEDLESRFDDPLASYHLRCALYEVNRLDPEGCSEAKRVRSTRTAAGE